jgi:hypothetical protein
MSITTAMVKQYNANIQLLAQQMDTRFAKAVRIEPLTGEYGFFDQIGATEAVKKTTRHAPTPLVNTPHARRRVTGYPYEWADLIDRPDIARLLTDPTSAYVRNAVYAMFRGMDDEIISAADGTAYTGKDGGTSTSYDSDNTVAVTIRDDGSGATGLNVAKIRYANRIMNANEVPQEDRFLAIAAQQHDELMAETTTISRDYVSSYVVEDGILKRMFGFNIILSERLGTDDSTYRKCIFWQKDGLLLAKNDDLLVDVGIRRDLSLSKQVFVSMDLGATRMEESRVGMILCAES